MRIKITETPGRRKRFTLSLRVFMVLILVLGGSLGWRVRRASLQRRVVATIQRAGGRVWYDYQHVRLPNGQDRFLPNAQLWAPAWLRRAIGDEYFQEVARVTFLYRDGRSQGTPISPDELLGVVARLDRLEFLNLHEFPLTDPGIERIGQMAGLVDLTIQSPHLEERKVTAAGLAHLGNLTKLRSLRLVDFFIPDGTQLPWTFLSRLAHLESLEVFFDSRQVSDWTMDSAILRELRGLTHLRRVMLPGTNARDDDMAHLAALTQLESITLAGSGISDAGLAHLAGLTSLQGLSLPGANQVTDAGVAHLAGLTRLGALDLKGSTVTDAGLAHLRKLNQLEQLSIGPHPGDSAYGDFIITDTGLAHLSGMTRLRILDIPLARVTDAGLAHLSGLTALSDLNLCAGAPLTDAGMAHLANLGKLSTLSLFSQGGTGVTDPGLRQLAKLSGLASLSLNGPGITDAGLAYLAPLTKLRLLHLYGTGVTDAGLAHLAGMTLGRLEIDNARLTDAGLVHLASLPNLRDLSLRETEVTDAGLASLASLPALRRVDVNYTRVTDAGVAQVRLTRPGLFVSHGMRRSQPANSASK